MRDLNFYVDCVDYVGQNIFYMGHNFYVGYVSQMYFAWVQMFLHGSTLFTWVQNFCAGQFFFVLVNFFLLDEIIFLYYN